jgi:hypothetical protein
MVVSHGKRAFPAPDVRSRSVSSPGDTTVVHVETPFATNAHVLPHPPRERPRPQPVFASHVTVLCELSRLINR